MTGDGAGLFRLREKGDALGARYILGSEERRRSGVSGANVIGQFKGL